MKNSSWKTGSATGSTESETENTARQGKLYVAYINEAMINSSVTVSDTGSFRKKSSVFSTSGGAYYIDGMPVILSLDEEAMLYDEELYEYY